MHYATAMPQAPPTVTDEMSARLLERLGAAALLELTAIIAAANHVSRRNATLVLESQGLSEACGLKPLDVPLSC